jgi:hypothetical protein
MSVFCRIIALCTISLIVVLGGQAADAQSLFDRAIEGTINHFTPEADEGTREIQRNAVKSLLEPRRARQEKHYDNMIDATKRKANEINGDRSSSGSRSSGSASRSSSKPASKSSSPRRSQPKETAAQRDARLLREQRLEKAQEALREERRREAARRKAERAFTQANFHKWFVQERIVFMQDKVGKKDPGGRITLALMALGLILLRGHWQNALMAMVCMTLTYPLISAVCREFVPEIRVLPFAIFLALSGLLTYYRWALLSVCYALLIYFAFLVLERTSAFWFEQVAYRRPVQVIRDFQFILLFICAGTLALASHRYRQAILSAIALLFAAFSIALLAAYAMGHMNIGDGRSFIDYMTRLILWPTNALQNLTGVLPFKTISTFYVSSWAAPLGCFIIAGTTALFWKAKVAGAAEEPQLTDIWALGSKRTKYPAHIPAWQRPEEDPEEPFNLKASAQAFGRRSAWGIAALTGVACLISLPILTGQAAGHMSYAAWLDRGSSAGQNYGQGSGESYESGDTYRVIAQQLNMRLGPSADYGKDGILMKGASVHVLHINSQGWAKLDNGNWVSSKYLRKAH